MRCPHCGSDDDKVVDSRTLANGESIRRRRECLACGFRFTSYERIEEKPLMVVKRDGRREPFERSKLEKGVVRALEKRPVSQLSIENLVNEIEDEAAMRGKTANEIATTELGEMVLRELFALDKVAYVRFASVYRKFETLEEFLVVIEGLARGAASAPPPAASPGATARPASATLATAAAVATAAASAPAGAAAPAGAGSPGAVTPPSRPPASDAAARLRLGPKAPEAKKSSGESLFEP